MGVFKRGKYWHVKFRLKSRTYTKSSRSTLKKDALDLERQMRQKFIDTQILGRREHITLYAACDALLSYHRCSVSAGGHTSVKTTERAYAAFVKNERFKQTIELLDQPNQPTPKCVT